MKKSIKIQQFIQTRIKQTQQQSKQCSDSMAKLKLATTQVSFAHILNQYMETNKYMFDALLHLAKVYILNQSYNQALIQARLARKQAEHCKDGSKERATLLIAECMVRQKKFEDAHQILYELQLPEHAQDCRQNLYQLLLEVQTQLREENKSYETLSKLQQIIKAKGGDKSVEYGFLLVKKGKTIGNFGKYKQAINDIIKGVDILIQRKCKQKKQIAQVYLTMAEYYRNLNNLDKQYSSLICAHSMAKQLENSEKEVLPIIHMLASNLMERQEYSKALKQLKIAKNMEKQMYGESSAQIGKTVKKITEVLSKLNLKSEVKKYQQEYSRIIGSGSSTLKQKTLNHQKLICI